MQKNTIFLVCLTIFSFSIANAQVGIGITAPEASLDVVATNPTGTATTTDGLLIPRVTRERARAMTGITTSTLVYVGTLNAGTQTGKAQFIDTIGFYYFDGSDWRKISNGSNDDWKLTGNTGTTAGTNFLGTTDAQDVRIKTNSNDRWNISNANSGQLQSYSLGTAALPTYSWQGDQNTGLFSSSADNLDFSTDGTARFRIPNANQVHALSLGTAALPFYSFSADTDTGIWSPTANNLAFSTAGSERARIDSNGNTGIGTTSPTHRLNVKNDIANAGVMCVENANSAGFDGIYFSEGAFNTTNYRGHVGHVNSTSGFAQPGTFQIASGDRDMLFSATNGSNSFTEIMRIDNITGFVGINTNPTNISPPSPQPTSTLHVNGSVAVGITTVTGTTTLTNGVSKVIVANGSSNITITLPNPNTCTGRLISFSRDASSSGTITLDPTGSNNIQNLSGTVSNTTTIPAHSVAGAGVNIQFWSDGSVWYR